VDIVAAFLSRPGFADFRRACHLKELCSNKERFPLVILVIVRQPKYVWALCLPCLLRHRLLGRDFSRMPVTGQCCRGAHSENAVCWETPPSDGSRGVKQTSDVAGLDSLCQFVPGKHSFTATVSKFCRRGQER